MERKISWQSIHSDSLDDDPRLVLARKFREEHPEDEEGVAEEIENLPVVIETPLGLSVLDDRFSLLNQMEWRIAHTNFPVCKKVMTIVNFCPGVDSLSILSRYSFVIGFGKMFDSAEVRREIERLLINIEEYDEELYFRQEMALREEF